MARSSSTPKKVYKYVHTEDVTIDTNLTGRACDTEWVRITDDGKITVKGTHSKGYAWDGCSPKFNFMDLIFGTPDGRFDYETRKQITYYASLFHDALYQMRGEIDISRKEADVLFKINLKRAGFMHATIYYLAVRLGGRLYGSWKTKKTKQKTIITTAFSWLPQTT